MRVRILALVAEAELTVGELTGLLDELQPNVSRHASALRQGELILERRHGTRSFLRLSERAIEDVVVQDALATGRQLCADEGRLSRVLEVIRAREALSKTNRSFAESHGSFPPGFEPTPAYVLGLSRVFSGRKLAAYVSTGHVEMLDVLSPFFQRVVAFDGQEDSSVEQGLAIERRILERGYENVVRTHRHFRDASSVASMSFGACAVFALDVLNRRESLERTLSSLVSLLRSTGTLVLYETRTELDFQPEELRHHAASLGFESLEVRQIPKGFVSGRSEESGPRWLLLSGNRR
jgi:DNA-binding transcriptional ArsR family regulator